MMMMEPPPSPSEFGYESGSKHAIYKDETICGGPKPIYKHKDLLTDKALKKAAKLAMEDLEIKNEGNKYKIKRLITGRYYRVAGDAFDLDLEVTDQNGKSYLYSAHLYRRFSSRNVKITGKLIPEYVKPNADEVRAKLIEPIGSVSHHFEKLSDNKKSCLINLFKKQSAQARQFPRTIVWCETKSECKEVKKILKARNLRVESCGGEGESEAVSKFREGLADILVLCGSAPCGLDEDKVAVHVVNLILPKTMKAYVSRIGYTSRGGRMTSFYTDRDMALVADIKKAIVDTESGKCKVQVKEIAAQEDTEGRSGISKFQNLEDSHCGEPLPAASSSQGHQIINC